MKKSIIILISALIINVFSFSVFAQQRKMDMREYEKRKMEFIKKEAGLTQEEANKYFPLNSELSQKKFELNKNFRDKTQNMKKGDMSDEEYRKLLEGDMNLKLKEAELDKEYSDKFEKALSPQKLYKAQQAERNFMMKEVSKFREERGNSGTRKQMNNRNNSNNNRGGRR